MQIRPAFVTLVDTASGYGCIANLPAGATGFATIELKSTVVTRRDTGRVVALFRCN
jgi:hypothetical protein